MTTTSLTYIESTYEVGFRHVNFFLRGSTPTSGEAFEGVGEWRVYRGGSLIHSVNNTLEFAWRGLDADVVHGRFSDGLGDHGEWASYTYSVAGAYTLQYYVNGSTGNDTTGDGTSGLPWATIGKAVTEVRAVLTTDQVAAIHIAEGQTYNLASASPWPGGTTRRRCDFLRWGTASTRPQITNSGSFSSGMRESFVIDDINVAGPGSGDFVNLFRFGGVGSDRSPYDCAVLRCDASSFDRGIAFDDSTVTSADRQYQRFLCLEDVEFDQMGTFHLYGYAYPECWLFRDVLFLDTITPGGSPIRFGRLARSYFENWRVTPSASAVANAHRFIMGDGAGEGAMHSISFSDCKFLVRGFFGIRMESDDRANWVNNISWSDSEFDGQSAPSFSVEAHASGLDFHSIAFRNCYSGREHIYSTNAALASGYDKIRYYNCASSREDWAGEGVFVRTGGDAASIADGCFEAHSCFGYFSIAGNDDTRSLFQVPTAAKVGSVTYSRIGKVDSPAGTQGIINGSAPSGTNGSDVSTTYNLTGSGATFGDFDPELTSDTGDNELIGAGMPHAYSIDANGFLRDASTPDVGPYEYGASAEPEGPDEGVTGTGAAVFSGFTASGSGTVSDPDPEPVLADVEPTNRREELSRHNPVTVKTKRLIPKPVKKKIDYRMRDKVMGKPKVRRMPPDDTRRRVMGVKPPKRR